MADKSLPEWRRSFAAFDLEAATVAPELAYVTARYAALAPFGEVAELLSAGRRTRARCGTDACGSVRPLCSRMSRHRRNRRRRGRPNPSLWGLMAATSAAGTGRTSGISK
jgi:hypothetical protein